MSHFILKLLNGQDVFGTISTEDTNTKMVTLNNPLVWEEYVNEVGQTGTAMVKFCASTSDRKIPINISSVISMCAMSPDFAEFYDAAVALCTIMDEAYDENIRGMTNSIRAMIQDYQARKHANTTGDLVAYTSDTIH